MPWNEEITGYFRWRENRDTPLGAAFALVLRTRYAT